MDSIFVDKTFGDLLFKGYQFTNYWIVECLVGKSMEFNQMRGNSKILSLDGYDISGGKGFLSKVYKTTITFENNDKEYVFVVKIPGIESLSDFSDKNKEEGIDLPEMEAQIMVDMHNREVEFYSKLVHKMKSLKVPKCFGLREWIVDQQDGIVLMEYLGDTAIVANWFKPLTLNQIKSILDEVFVLQSNSLLIKGDWKGKYRSVSQKGDTHFIATTFDASWQLIKSYLTEDIYKDIEEDVVTMASHHDAIYHHNNCTLIKEPYCDSVLTHGDLWCNNLMFKKVNGQACDELATIIDWQALFECNCMNDICMPLLLTTTAEIRRHCFETILPEYFEKLKKFTEERKVEFNMSWEMFSDLYHFQLCSQSLIYLVGSKLLIDSYEGPDKLDTKTWNQAMAVHAENIVMGLRDAVDAARRLKPEWLVKKKVD